MKRSGFSMVEVLLALGLLALLAAPFLGLTRGAVSATRRGARQLAADQLADRFLSAVQARARGDEQAFDDLQPSFGADTWTPARQFPGDPAAPGGPLFPTGSPADFSSDSGAFGNLYQGFEYQLTVTPASGGGLSSWLARVEVRLRWPDQGSGGERSLTRVALVMRRAP